ncbi:MAG: hypothetical protein ACI35O_13325 [Bacillaceae bacterium]
MRRIIMILTIMILLVGCVPKQPAKVVQFEGSGTYSRDIVRVILKTNLPADAKITTQLIDSKLKKVVETGIGIIDKEGVANVIMPYPKDGIAKDSGEIQYEVSATFEPEKQNVEIKKIYGEYGEYIKKGTEGRVEVEKDGKKAVFLHVSTTIEGIVDGELTKMVGGNFMLDEVQE